MREWRSRVPALLADCAERWQLRLGEPYPPGAASVTVRAWLPDGAEAVLKVGFPHRESEHEAAALSAWSGNGAVRLLAHDPEFHALLLERCVPGTPLSACGEDEILTVAAALLRRLWIPASFPFRTLEEEVAGWLESLPSAWRSLGRPFERTLLDAALGALRELADSQGAAVLLSQDFHAGNVLRAKREPWLAIDPKPLLGEREFGVAALVRDVDGERRMLDRLDRLCGELGLDRARVRGWSLGQTLAWAFEDGGVLPEMVETARWLLQA